MCSTLLSPRAPSELKQSWPPPHWRNLSKFDQESFRLGKNIVLKHWYAIGVDGSETPQTNVWQEAELAAWVGRARGGQCTCDYGADEAAQVCEVLKKYRSVVAEKRGLVLGSQTPWAEANLLGFGARHVQTIEYYPTECNGTRHGACDKLNVVTPTVAYEKHLAAVAKSAKRGKSTDDALHDFAFSYSSYAHDGLGRYGDPIMPHADFESVQKVWCMLKPGAIFFLAFPVSKASDFLIFNVHRIYGPKRLPIITAGFDVIDVIGPYATKMPPFGTLMKGGGDTRGIYTWKFQPVLVLRKRA